MLSIGRVVQTDGRLVMRVGRVVLNGSVSYIHSPHCICSYAATVSLALLSAVLHDLLLMHRDAGANRHQGMMTMLFGVSLLE